MLILVACKPLQEVNVTGVKDFHLGSISVDGISGELSLTIKNPNNVGFTIYPSEFDILLGNVKLGKAKLNKKVHIGANAEKGYTFKLKSNLENVSLINIMNLVSSGSSKKITITGNLKVGKFLVRKKYPVNYSDHIKL